MWPGTTIVRWTATQKLPLVIIYIYKCSWFTEIRCSTSCCKNNSRWKWNILQCQSGACTLAQRRAKYRTYTGKEAQWRCSINIIQFVKCIHNCTTRSPWNFAQQQYTSKPQLLYHSMVQNKQLSFTVTWCMVLKYFLTKWNKQQTFSDRFRNCRYSKYLLKGKWV